jgi:hypothetical protein
MKTTLLILMTIGLHAGPVFDATIQEGSGAGTYVFGYGVPGEMWDYSADGGTCEFTGDTHCNGDMNIEGQWFSDYFIDLQPETGLQDFYVAAYQDGQLAASEEFETWGTLTGTIYNAVLGFTTDTFTFSPTAEAPDFVFAETLAVGETGSAVAAVPEPSPFGLLLIGFIMVVALARKRT